jgi:hypothetical protein
MHQRVRVLRPAAILAATALALTAGLGAGTASAGKKGKKLKVTCEQLYDEVAKTGAQLQIQYNGMGYTMDGFTTRNACQKQGKRVRIGGGFMHDVHREGDPPFPGETNPSVQEYFWTWDQTVTRTKKGKLRSVVTGIRCEKIAGSLVLPC